MDRHDLPFPNKDYFSMLNGLKDVLPNRIEECWRNGIFDEYSDQHFLIRALYNDAEFFKPFFTEHQLTLNYGYDYHAFPNTFLMNLNSRINFLYSCFGQSKIEKFLKDQLSAGKQNYRQNAFFEALSELHLLSYFAAFGPSTISKMTYEPPMGANGANPEARFEYDNGIILDIEAKTPNFPERDRKKNIVFPGLLIDDPGRVELNDFCKQHGIECRLPRVLKLTDFFESAAKKFVVSMTPTHVNLLAINWTYVDIKETELFEPTKLLCNQINGIFFRKDIALKMGISEEALQKITAVFLYRISEEALLFSDLRYLFKNQSYRIIMNPFSKHGNIQVVHDLTHMAVHLPQELDDNMDVYFDLEQKDWSEELQQIHRIIGDHLL